MNQIKTMIKIVIVILILQCSSGTLLHLARSYFSSPYIQIIYAKSEGFGC